MKDDQSKSPKQENDANKNIVLNSEAGDLLADYTDRNIRLEKHHAFEIHQAEIAKKKRAQNKLITTLAKANQKISIKMAAALLAGSTMMSAVLGI